MTFTETVSMGMLVVISPISSVPGWGCSRSLDQDYNIAPHLQESSEQMKEHNADANKSAGCHSHVFGPST